MHAMNRQRPARRNQPKDLQLSYHPPVIPDSLRQRPQHAHHHLMDLPEIGFAFRVVVHVRRGDTRFCNADIKCLAIVQVPEKAVEPIRDPRNVGEEFLSRNVETGLGSPVPQVVDDEPPDDVEEAFLEIRPYAMGAMESGHTGEPVGDGTVEVRGYVVFGGGRFLGGAGTCFRGHAIKKGASILATLL